MSERCALFGERVEAGDLDAVEVGGGIVHEDCLAERKDDGLFGEPDPESAAAGRGAAFECSTAEIERERRQRSARRAKERRKVG
jgi:hypothetical protein